MSRPKRILVEFEDGTQKSADISQVSTEVLPELVRLGLIGVHDTTRVPAQYALLEWADGWKEVVAVDADVLGMLRYYALERVDEVGRLAFDKPDDYPQLILVSRLPRDVKSCLLTGVSGSNMVRFEEKASVEEGGKAERILYDAKKPAFVGNSDQAAAGARLAELKALLAEELKKKGLDASRLLSMEGKQRAEACNGLARAMGIRAMERQGDLYGFLQHLLEGL